MSAYLSSDDPVSDSALSPVSSADLFSVYFAVRSSAVAEDLADASFAGQQDTYLNVQRHEVIRMILTCWASYWNARAMKYRHDASKDHLSSGMAVVVQKMVKSEISGVMFTSDPVSGTERVIIEASWGLGESIVSGLVTPDSYLLTKPALEVEDFTVNVKEKGYYLIDGKDQLIDLPKEKAEARCADDSILKMIGEQGLALEKHFGCPQDVEWGVEDGQVYILQSRNITTLPDTCEKDDILWSRGYGDEYWADATTLLARDSNTAFRYQRRGSSSGSNSRVAAAAAF